MHRFIFRWRFLALAAPLAALTAFMFFAGGTGTPRTLATGPTPGPTPDLTGISCADVFVDISPANGIADDINGNSVNGDDGDITSLTMTRIEPSQTSPGNWDVTSVSYLGKDTDGNLVPNGPPGPGCQTSSTAAASSAEANRFGGAFSVDYANQYGTRPTAIGTYAQTNNYGPGTGDFTFSTCGYSESSGTWIRVDSDTHIVKTGTGTKNSGNGTLWLAAGSPSSGAFDSNGDGTNDATTVPTSCSTSGAFPYTFVYTSHSRDARTDHTAASVGACGTDTVCQRNVTLGIGQDPNGPSPKVKGVDQVADTADTLADDWDGDGCPDWDELGNAYMPGPPGTTLQYPPTYNWSTNPVNGLDPFNPNDCDTNWTSTMSLNTIILHDTTKCSLAQVAGGTCGGNGQSFRCLGSFAQTKSGTQQPLAFRLGCYSDSTLTVVNSSYPEVPYDGTRSEDGAGPNTCSDNIDNGGDGKKDAQDSDCHVTTCGPAPAGMCGDGKTGSPPPGCVSGGDASRCASNTRVPNCPTLPCPTSRYVYVGIDPTSYPVTNPASGNYYDTTANQIHLGGCFAGFGGGTFGNVFGSAVIDAHTGVGSFSIFLNQTVTNCQNGTPSGSPLPGQIETVELRTEKNLPVDCTSPSPTSSDCHKYDSDRDGCADARELGSNQGMGGERDPFNPYDFFNPEKVQTPNTQTVADILKVVQQFGKNQGNVAYTNGTDRTAVFGGPNWGLGPPDGQQTVADILAAIKQFNQGCPAVTP